MKLYNAVRIKEYDLSHWVLMHNVEHDVYFEIRHNIMDIVTSNISGFILSLYNVGKFVDGTDLSELYDRFLI